MKQTLLKFILPLIIAGASFLVSKAAASGLISAADVPEITAKAEEVSNGVAAILSTVGAVWVARALAKYFPKTPATISPTGKAKEDEGNGNGPVGGAALLALVGTTAVIMGVLPSCSTDAYNVSGQIGWRDVASGAKAVINIRPNRKLPVLPKAQAEAAVDAKSGK